MSQFPTTNITPEQYLTVTETDGGLIYNKLPDSQSNPTLDNKQTPLPPDGCTYDADFNLKCEENTLPKNSSTKQLIYVGLGIVAIIIVAKVLTKK